MTLHVYEYDSDEIPAKFHQDDLMLRFHKIEVEGKCNWKFEVSFIIAQLFFTMHAHSCPTCLDSYCRLNASHNAM